MYLFIYFDLESLKSYRRTFRCIILYQTTSVWYDFTNQHTHVPKCIKPMLVLEIIIS